MPEPDNWLPSSDNWLTESDNCAGNTVVDWIGKISTCIEVLN